MPQTKEYDASEITITVDGTTVADIETIGYDQSKTHEIEKTLDGNAIWVDGIGEYSGTVAVKAVSDNIANMQFIFDNNNTFNISITYPDGETRDSSTFKNAKITDFAPGDYELEGMPAYEADWECPFVTHTSSI